MRKRKKSVKRSEPVRSPADSAAGRTNVLIEDFQRQLRVVADGISASRESIERQMNARFDEVDNRLGGLAGTLTVHTNAIAELKRDVGTLKSDVSDIKGELISINEKLDRKADKAQVDALEVRVGALETG